MKSTSGLRTSTRIFKVQSTKCLLIKPLIPIWELVCVSGSGSGENHQNQLRQAEERRVSEGGPAGSQSLQPPLTRSDHIPGASPTPAASTWPDANPTTRLKTCVMFQTTLLHFWEKTSHTMAAISESFKGCQNYELATLKVRTFLQRDPAAEGQEVTASLTDVTRRHGQTVWEGEEEN